MEAVVIPSRDIPVYGNEIPSVCLAHHGEVCAFRGVLVGIWEVLGLGVNVRCDADHGFLADAEGLLQFSKAPFDIQKIKNLIYPVKSIRVENNWISGMSESMYFLEMAIPANAVKGSRKTKS